MRLISLSLLLMLFSCEKTEYNEIEIVGHAGMGLDMQNSIYHDNSLEAIQLALSYGGSNGVEVDVQMDNEGCLWLFHDELMDGIAFTCLIILKLEVWLASLFWNFGGCFFSF